MPQVEPNDEWWRGKADVCAGLAECNKHMQFTSVGRADAVRGGGKYDRISQVEPNDEWDGGDKTDVCAGECGGKSDRISQVDRWQCVKAGARRTLVLGWQNVTSACSSHL